MLVTESEINCPIFTAIARLQVLNKTVSELGTLHLQREVPADEVK